MRFAHTKGADIKSLHGAFSLPLNQQHTLLMQKKKKEKEGGGEPRRYALALFSCCLPPQGSRVFPSGNNWSFFFFTIIKKNECNGLSCVWNSWQGMQPRFMSFWEREPDSLFFSFPFFWGDIANTRCTERIWPQKTWVEDEEEEVPWRWSCSQLAEVVAMSLCGILGVCICAECACEMPRPSLSVRIVWNDDVVWSASAPGEYFSISPRGTKKKLQCHQRFSRIRFVRAFHLR